MLSHLSDDRRGAILGVIAYLIWGFAALYWVQTKPVDARDLLAHRALWSIPVVVLCLLFSGQMRSALALLKKPRSLAVLSCCAFLSTINWMVFLWAVTHDHATEASLGYFILPLINVVIGLTLFRESIDTPQKLAVAFAVAGMLVQIVHFGGLPWVSLGLAITFSLYSAVRKAVAVGAVEGLFIELLCMAPFAIAWLIYREGGGLGLYGLRVDLFLVGAGVMTAVPLMTYVAASKLLPLTALGLVFYIGPSAQLLVAVVAFGEPFSRVQFLSFGLVWMGLALMTVGSLRQARLQKRLVTK